MMAGVFFVVFFFGSPAMTIGPVEKAACEQHLADESAKMDAFYLDPVKVAKLREVSGGKNYTRADVTFACSAERPVIKDAVRP